MNILYHHLPKCGGRTFIQTCKDNNINIIQESFKPWNLGKYIDFTKDIVLECEHLYTLDYGWHNYITRFHNPLSKNEIMYLFSKAISKGWKIITFIRDPRDALCSLYYYFWEFINQNNLNESSTWIKLHYGFFPYKTLDEFLYNINVRFIPEWHNLFDFIGLVNDNYFNYFFKSVYDVNYKSLCVGQTNNKGIDKLYRDGQISSETYNKVTDSVDYRLYLDIIKERNLLNGPTS